MLSDSTWCRLDDLVNYRDEGKTYPMLRATVNGVTHMIPEAWIKGFCHSGRPLEYAIRHWHDQVMRGEEI